jgi:WD40-like Beta Propeller Repeat
MKRHVRAVVLVAVGIVAALAAVVAGTGVAQAKHFGDWGTADPVPNVNDPMAPDGCPIESPDGLSLYIASMRGPGGDNDIWVATRADASTDFGAATMLPEPVNSGAEDFCPTPLRGGSLLFVSNRGGTDAYGTQACGGGDIYLTRRSPVTGQWESPRNLGCAPQGPNGPGTEYGPSLVETEAGTLLFFSSGGLVGTNTQDIYVSRQRADGGFGSPEPVTGLNSAFDDAMPNVRKDGLEIVFTSNRPGGQGAFDVYSSTRSSVLDLWSPAVNLGAAINTAAPETRPSLSWDGERLYFGRAGDIYVSQRSKR